MNTKNASANNKTAKKGTKVTGPAQKGTKVNNLAKLNTAKAAKDATAQKESIYNYPESCKTKEERKTFRRKARAAAERFDAQIKKLKKSKEPEAAKELTAMIKDQAKFRATTYAE